MNLTDPRLHDVAQRRMNLRALVVQLARDFVKRPSDKRLQAELRTVLDAEQQLDDEFKQLCTDALADEDAAKG